jgi:EAL domain-containing protein (putative c-di-GMP-specific phosphodiesterase class I)
MSVVAEGVEDETVFNMLSDMGCDVIQGWYIGEPETGQYFINNWVYPHPEERPQIQAA